MSTVIQDSRKSLVITLLIFLVIGIFVFTHGNQQGASFELEGASFILHGPEEFSVEIDLNRLQSIETREVTAVGSCVDGGESGGYLFGIWENEEFGTYHLCKLSDVPTCVVVIQDNGSVTVFNFESNETTLEFGCTFLEYLQQKGFL